MEAGAAQTRLPIALTPGASLASFWASRKKLAAGAAKLPCHERSTPIIAPSSGPSGHLPPKGKAFEGDAPIRPRGKAKKRRAAKSPY